jgi:hypothetical protein
MIAIQKPLTSKDTTASEIAELIEGFYSDLDNVYTDGTGGKRVKVSTLTLPQIFDLVRNIPYRRDPNNPPVEVIARPYYLFKYAKLGLDCKKKAILMGSWVRSQQDRGAAIPFRLIGSSERKDKKVHHIFPEIFINKEWKSIDATYPHYKLFEKKTSLTKKEVL